MVFLTANKINKPKSTQAKTDGTLDTTKQPSQQHKLAAKNRKTAPKTSPPV